MQLLKEDLSNLKNVIYFVLFYLLLSGCSQHPYGTSYISIRKFSPVAVGFHIRKTYLQHVKKKRLVDGTN